MLTETFPDWVWYIYYSFFLLTLGAAVFSLFRKKLRKRFKLMSSVTIVVGVTLPIVSLLGGISWYTEELNELGILVSRLQQGDLWSIYVVAGSLYLLVWWLIFLFILLSKNKKI
ncbi:hypothetical protein VBD025_15605 [Virgibacillus flavescens]|uniref:hypothetical protein n=1 Tax=Virgibacillus flavescens TaxID=1611422 RepID=UPI003D3278C3